MGSPSEVPVPPPGAVCRTVDEVELLVACGLGPPDVERPSLAQEQGVPTVPGSAPLETVEDALACSEEIGFPVIIKAAAGGGGKGMRVALDRDAFAQAFALARQEALAAFNSDKVYIEKYLARPRHVEVQVMGDQHGRIMHMCERDCSVQRRHQKLIEEAPSPALDQSVRERMGDAAVKLAQAIAYVGAGTIEFLFDEDGSYYFMEMNTRIQVEHPVTEMVTGIDIVKEQIRIASGDRLSFRQSDITFTGHSIECRVNAEDPVTFTPSPGLIHAWSVPGGPGVRVDTFAHSECTVSPYYDSMIAKIIVHGRDRQEAIARMRRTLEMTVIEGIKTTIPLHRAIMEDENFQKGDFSTKFMEEFKYEV